MPEPGDIVTSKVGPLPLVVWVAGGAGVVLLFIMLSHKSGGQAQNLSTNQVSALAPTEAEAFGTIEQQQQDVTNALTTLGNNQSALGGSISTLSGQVVQLGQSESAAFQNLQNGQSQIEAGQSAAASQAQNYYTGLANAITTYYNSLQGGLNSISGSQQTISTQQQNALQQVLAALQSQIGGVSQQVGQVQTQQQADSLAQNYGFANMDALMAYMFYQIPNRYNPYFPASPTASQNLATAEAPS